MINYLLEHFDWLLVGMTATAVLVFISLFFVDAGYGKFYTNKWGPAVHNKLGWVMMEAPSFILMLAFYIAWADKAAMVPLGSSSSSNCTTSTGRSYSRCCSKVTAVCRWLSC